MTGKVCRFWGEGNENGLKLIVMMSALLYKDIRRIEVYALMGELFST